MAQHFPSGEQFANIEETRRELGEIAREKVTELSKELGIEIGFEETPDTVFVTMPGDNKTMGFMKMNDLEKKIEARVRFPKDEVEAALQKLDELKSKRP